MWGGWPWLERLFTAKAQRGMRYARPNARYGAILMVEALDGIPEPERPRVSAEVGGCWTPGQVFAARWTCFTLNAGSRKGGSRNDGG
jgi:hypothetical protein